MRKKMKSTTYPTVAHPIYEIPQRSTDDHAEDQLIEQRPRVEHTQIEVRDHSNGNYNQPHERNVIGKEAKGGPAITDIVEYEIIANQGYGWANFGRAQVFYDQGFCPLVKCDHENDDE